MRVAATEYTQQLDNLRKWFPEGSTVYTILRHVNRSGMRRHISVISLTGAADGGIDIRHPNYAASIVLGRTLKTGWHDSVVCNGCGMDMGFDLAYAISSKLYGDGYKLKHQWL